MVVVKIIRSSIKKNPNAGNTQSFVRGNTTATFECKGKFPKHLLSKVQILNEKQDGSFCSGVLNNPNDFNYLIAEFVKLKGKAHIAIKTDFGVEEIEHLPEPTYLYKYRNPKIKCGHCGKLIPVNDIDIDYTDDGVKFTECPRCKEIDSFEEIKYESIKEALKDKKPL